MLLRAVFGLFTLLSVLSLGTPDGVAQTPSLPCGPKKEVFAAAKKKFNEEPKIIGTTNESGQEMVFVLLEDPEDKSWTAGILSPNGMFCIIASGDNLQLSTRQPGVPL